VTRSIYISRDVYVIISVTAAAGVSVCSIVEVKAYSHQGLPLSYELTTDTGLPSTEFAIHPSTGVVDLLRPLDYETDPHQYHLKVKVVENGRPARSSMVNVRITRGTISSSSSFNLLIQVNNTMQIMQRVSRSHKAR